MEISLWILSLVVQGLNFFGFLHVVSLLSGSLFIIIICHGEASWR